LKNIADDSTYRLLEITRGATREEIEIACLRLWYRYRVLRNTPIWVDLSRQIERMRTTLLEATDRSHYQSRNQNFPQPKKQPSSLAHFFIGAMVSAASFNLMIDLTSPDQWDAVWNVSILSTLLGCATGTFALCCRNILQHLHNV
jgi:hypothetical protein